MGSNDGLPLGGFSKSYELGSTNNYVGSVVMKKTFWDRTAKIYDRFMRKDHKAYQQMDMLIDPVVRHKQVLELATGTGLIAKHIVGSAEHIEATDASAEMIEQAKRGVQSSKLHFSVQDMLQLSFWTAEKPCNGALRRTMLFLMTGSGSSPGR